ncbi:MAG: hypothetical protein ACRCVJ_18650 [Clostridium sp.]|uniref:hypothetical protein n=1 Tax=Clostridium sp. TaxID=1506 RepID=UPI003F3263DF
MKVKELKNEFETDKIEVLKVGAIFHTKEYSLGKVAKDNFSYFVERYGEYEIDYYSYEDGVIVLKGDNWHI